MKGIIENIIIATAAFFFTGFFYLSVTFWALGYNSIAEGMAALI